MNILDEIKGQLTSSVLDGMASKVGGDSSAVSDIVESALPALLGGLTQNAAQADGAEALSSALDKHDSSVLGRLGSIFNDDDKGDENDSGRLESDGRKVLHHIMQGKEDSVVASISSQTSGDPSMVKKVLSFLGPIVLAQLSKTKKDQGLGASALGGLLSANSKDAGILDNPIAKMLLDKNGDGKVGFGDALSGLKKMLG